MVLCAVKKSERSVKHRPKLNATGIVPGKLEQSPELPGDACAVDSFVDSWHLSDRLKP
jgi:hypothetical protein